MSGEPDLIELLHQLGACQRQIEAELANGANKADRRKIAAAFAAGREFARDAAPYCHSPADHPAGMAA